MATEKVSAEDWQQARRQAPMTQLEVAKLLYCSIDSVRSWDGGRNPIGRGLFNYFLLMTGQHPTQQIQDKSRTISPKNKECIMSDKILKDMIKKMEGYANKVDSPEKTTRETVSNALSTYFVCDLQNYSFKDDIASMEAPIFSLSTQEDKQIWVWTSDDGKKTVEVEPSVYGRATVFDKDVLIFAASQLMAGINKGEIPSKTIRFKARD